MSWLSKGLKKVRKAAGLPPLTFRTAINAGASFVPGGSIIAGAINKTPGSPGIQAIAKAQVESAFDNAATQASQLRTTVTTAKTVSDYAHNPMTWVAVGAVVLLGASALGRRR